MRALPLLLLFVSMSSLAQFQRDCSGDPTLIDRPDVLHCESWESTNWWQNGYVDSARNPISGPIPETAIVSQTDEGTACPSGSCLKVFMNAGSHGTLAHKWLLSNVNLQPEELYLSYYIYLSDNWIALKPGGKFPGLADERISADPGGQCGNGGAYSDGINCWSSRSNFQECGIGGNPPDCASTPGATTMFGSYLYVYGNDIFSGGTGWGAHWIIDPWDRTSPPSGSSCQSHPMNVYCGTDHYGELQNGRWYHVEMYLKMNTPEAKEPAGMHDRDGLTSFFNGKGDGKLYGWVDGQLAYQKDNVIYRLVGHDNLHIKTVWLDVFMGGSQTNPVNQAIYLDQMVVSTSRIGPRGSSVDTEAPNAPTNLQAN